MSEISIVSYHGTNLDHITNIINNNFKPSVGDAEWLGTGAYFFTDGFANDCESEEAAAKWAEVSSWDNKTKKLKYVNCCTIQVLVKVDEEFLLDLTTQEGMKIFNYYKKLFSVTLKKAKREFKENSPNFRDGQLINDIRKRLRIDVIKGCFYFKFKEERVFKIDYRLPNCTVIAIFNPNHSIDKTSIKLIRKFSINHET